MDFYALQDAWTRRVYDVLDHRFINDIEGLHNPTTEIIAIWIWSQLKREIPSLCRIEVKETPQFGAIYEGV